MKVRSLLIFLAIGAAIIIASCSSGLGNNPLSPAGDTSPATTNRPVGLDLGLEPTSPVAESCATGVVVPAIGSFPQRDLVLLAFTTASDAANGDGNGTALSRDLVTDANVSSDVFIAAICSQDVETRAFSQSLAGKLRHPRCVTCHSMQAADTTAFATGLPHAGPPPGVDFPINAPERCVQCHTEQTSFPVEGWQAPAASFDLRFKTVAELAEAAQNVPADEPIHFTTDPRVLWALDSGVTPIAQGRNGAADDDHDGNLETSDSDGVIRTVPGGSAVFLQQIKEWNESGNVVDASGAVKDITLVSRAANTTSSGNGASARPVVKWVANSNFTAPGILGTLYIIYESDASDLATGDTNGATDVFRTAVDLISDSAGILDLVVNGNAVLVSATNGTTTAGNGASMMAAVGGIDANMVAFQSLATDLISGFTDANGASSPDIYLRNLTSNDTHLLSHQTGNQATGGNGPSTDPNIDPTGDAVAFASSATDLIAGDSNGVGDVFYTIVSGSAPFNRMRASVSESGNQGSGGNSANPSIYLSSGNRVLIGFESDKTNLAPALTATTNAFVFDSSSGNSTLLNQKLATGFSEIGDGSARNVVISAEGSRVAFESAASNIDTLREDNNDSTDVFLANLDQVLAGKVLPYRISLTTVEAADGNGASFNPCFSTFATPSDNFGVGFATYKTTATNLGTSDSTNLVVAFLDETADLLADFSPSATSGPVPFAVTFTDASVGVPTSWQWDFNNDGTVDSTEQSPSFTYTAPGTYTVKLTVTNEASSNTAVRTDLIRSIGIPVVDFTPSVVSGETPLSVTFSDNGTTEQPTSWAWDFGDGGTSTQAPPVTYVYASAGTWTVALTATNAAGSAAETKTDLIQTAVPVVAGFTATPVTGSAPLTVDFDASGSAGATSFSWDFGDGNSANGSTAQNVYASAGAYTATLTATSPIGITDTASTVISVGGDVSASFSLSAASAYADGTSTITVDASGSTGTQTLSLYEWDYDNDGQFDDATGANPAPINVLSQFPVASPNVAPYTQGYTIRLKVTDEFGSSGVDTKVFTSVAASSEISLTTVQDATIYEENPNNGGGAYDQFVSGLAYLSSVVGKRRALVKFDVSSLSSLSTILEAEMTLKCTKVKDDEARNVSIHRITTGWNEGTSVSGPAPTPPQAGQGVPQTGNDVTWAEASASVTNWITDGGDYEPTPSASLNVSIVGSYTWLTTASTVSDVQLWLNNSANNHGWLIQGEETLPMPSVGTVKWFGAKEQTLAADRPILTVTFRRPLP
jgi:PKD repeat protein